MRKQEQRLWDTFRNNKPPEMELERVENVVAAGMPDVYLRARRVSTWIELKAPNAPKREITRVLGDEGLNAAQINWHLQSAWFGLPTYVLIRDSRKRLWLLPGKEADLMNDLNADELDGACIAKDNWHDIYRELKNEN